jgi:hypothetical protein
MIYRRSMCIHTWTQCAAVGCVVCCGVGFCLLVWNWKVWGTLNTLLREWLAADQRIKIGFITLLEEKLTVFCEGWSLFCSHSIHRCNFLVLISKPMFLKRTFYCPRVACFWVLGHAWEHVESYMRTESLRMNIFYWMFILLQGVLICSCWK